ncbi:hypothetical protein [Micromonospora chersina]|uniref:hypothetical protein n=1 Tax=Micromonospora chersina TaxID=47854 RepID=UPI003D8B9A7D
MRKTMISFALVGAGLLTAACGGGGTADKAAPATPVAVGATSVPAATTEAAKPQEPKTVEAAKALEEKALDAYAAGDWRGVWDLYTKEGRAAITRDAYYRAQTECNPITGVDFRITGARMEGTDKAVVTYKRLNVAGTAEVRYEDGQWRHQPRPDSLKEYALGYDKMLDRWHDQGYCQED